MAGAQVADNVAGVAAKANTQAADDVAQAGAKAAAKASKVAGGVIIGVSAVFLVWDALDLTFTIRDLVNKKGSDAARSLRAKADELDKICSWYEEQLRQLRVIDYSGRPLYTFTLDSDYYGCKLNLSA